jgi:heptosyltransferase II
MILYIQTAFLGDLLLSIPTLKRLRELYPEREIHLLCRKNLGSLLKENKLVDVVHDQFVHTKPNLYELKETFSNLKFDLIICPHQSFRSTLMSALIKGKQKIGYSSWLNSWVFTKCLKRPVQLPEVLRQLYLLTSVDPKTKTQFEGLIESKAPFREIPHWTSMQLPSYQDVKKKKEWRAKYELSLSEPIVSLAPGSVWPTKQWGVEKYSQLAQELLKSKYQVVLLGSGAEKQLCDVIQLENPGVFNLAGKTKLTELAEVVAASDFLVCNDSGAMHIASTAGTPSVCIFGPTVLRFGYQPWNSSAVVVENEALSCRPCSTHGGKVCPLGTHECMKSILPHIVFKKITN